MREINVEVASFHPKWSVGEDYISLLHSAHWIKSLAFRLEEPRDIFRSKLLVQRCGGTFLFWARPWLEVGGNRLVPSSGLLQDQKDLAQVLSSEASNLNPSYEEFWKVLFTSPPALTFGRRCFTITSEETNRTEPKGSQVQKEPPLSRSI